MFQADWCIFLSVALDAAQRWLCFIICCIMAFTHSTGSLMRAIEVFKHDDSWYVRLWFRSFMSVCITSNMLLPADEWTDPPPSLLQPSLNQLELVTSRWNEWAIRKMLLKWTSLLAFTMWLPSYQSKDDCWWHESLYEDYKWLWRHFVTKRSGRVGQMGHKVAIENICWQTLHFKYWAHSDK